MTSSAAFSKPIRLQPDYPHAVSLILLGLLQAVSAAFIAAADLQHTPTASLLVLVQGGLLARLWACWQLNQSDLQLFIDTSGQARLFRPGQGSAVAARLPGGLSRRLGGWLLLVIRERKGVWHLWAVSRRQAGGGSWRGLLSHLSLRCD